MFREQICELLNKLPNFEFLNLNLKFIQFSSLLEVLILLQKRLLYSEFFRRSSFSPFQQNSTEIAKNRQDFPTLS